MQNDLDKYFRDNLEGRQFELKEAYWQQAQQLLADDERRRRRKAWFWWSGGAMVLLLVLAFFLLGEDSLRQNGAVAEQGIQLENATTQSNDVSQKEDKNAKDEFLEKPDNQEVVGRNDLSEEDVTAAKSSAISGSGTPSTAGAGLRTVPTNDRTLSDSTAQTEGGYRTKSGTSEGVTSSTSETMGGSDETEGNSLSENTDAPSETLLDDDTRIANTEAPDLLEVPQIFADGYFEDEPQVAEQELPRQPWSLAVEVGQLFQPTLSSSEQSTIGFQTGLMLRYDLSDEHDFYLAAGLRYQRRTGTFDFTKFNENRNYRFGLELDTNLLQPSSLHYLSFPVLVGWERGRHVVEGGASLDYLLGVRGELGSIQRTGEPPRRIFQASESGWLVEDGYKKMTSTVMLNYRYRVSRQWSFGVSANYTFGGILAAGPNGIFDGRALLREDDKLYFSACAAYILK